MARGSTCWCLPTRTRRRSWRSSCRRIAARRLARFGPCPSVRSTWPSGATCSFVCRRTSRHSTNTASTGSRRGPASIPKTRLTKLPVKGGGGDSLQFHVKARSRDGKSPFLFGGGSLTYQAGPHNSRIVENSRMKIEIDPYGIKSIYDKKADGTVSRAVQLHDSLLSLILKKPGNTTAFSRDFYNATLETCKLSGSAESPVLTMMHRFRQRSASHDDRQVVAQRAERVAV